MRRGYAILFAIWATAACAAVDGNATGPTAVPSASASSTPALVVPEITPALVGPPVRILWAPLQPQPLAVSVRVDPSAASAIRLPALVAATQQQLQNAQRSFTDATSYGLMATLQNLRDQKYNGSEEWMFATAFAPGPFADHVRALITTRRDNEIRTFHPGEATLESAWVRPSAGPFGDPASVALLEGTVTFTDEVATGAGKTTESHRWRIRALSQGQLYILDGVEVPAGLAAVPPFDPAALDREIAAQVSAHLHTEEAGPQAMPMAPFQGTAYWNARKGALDWLHELNARGTLTDRHFENVSAQIVQFRPTSYLGDGYVTVHLRGALVETMNGARHTYPVNESVVFQRFSFAQPFWMAVDGQNGDGTWIANGNYGTPQSTSHG